MIPEPASITALGVRWIIFFDEPFQLMWHRPDGAYFDALRCGNPIRAKSWEANPMDTFGSWMALIFTIGLAIGYAIRSLISRQRRARAARYRLG
jgi:hypothetical protein